MGAIVEMASYSDRLGEPPFAVNPPKSVTRCFAKRRAAEAAPSDADLCKQNADGNVNKIDPKNVHHF